MSILRATLLFFVCTSAGTLSAAERQSEAVRREIAALRKISQTIQTRLAKLEAKVRSPRGRSPSRAASRAAKRPAVFDFRFNTPEQTFITLKRALLRKQWHTVLACYTPRARDELARAMVLVSALASIGIKDKERRAAYAAELGRLNARHFPVNKTSRGERLDPIGEVLTRAIAKFVVDGEVPENLQESTIRSVLREIVIRRSLAKTEMTQLVKQIRNRDTYLVSVLSLLVKYGEPVVDYSRHILVALQATGNTASGSIVARYKTTRRITFKRINGRWRIDQMR